MNDKDLRGAILKIVYDVREGKYDNKGKDFGTVNATTALLTLIKTYSNNLVIEELEKLANRQGGLHIKPICCEAHQRINTLKGRSDEL